MNTVYHLILKKLTTFGILKWANSRTIRNLFNMTTVLVTGGMGFIGSNFIRFILNPTFWLELFVVS